MAIDPGNLYPPAYQDLATRITQLEQRMNTIEQREGDLTETAKRIVEGHNVGPAGAAAEVVALEGGQDATIQPVPGAADPQ